VTKDAAHAWPGVAEWLAAVVVVAVTAVVSTWPLATGPWLVPEHQDPLFSSWRLYQWARTLAGQSTGLFDGNIFHPATGVQLFSDPMVLPSLVAAPFLWAGAPVAVVYALMFWLAAVTAGLAMFACARAVSGSRWGGLVAAVVFVGSPIRLEQVVHLEMLWTACLPLSVLATVRAFDGGRRAPWMLGGALAGQMLCCIYYGVFLFTLWPLLAGVEWLRRRVLPPGVAWRIAAAVTVAALLVAVYALPFQRVRQQVGDRGETEIGRYSATLDSYASSSALNRVWGWTAIDAAETRLFPGLTAAVLAVAGATATSSPWVAAVSVFTAVAVDASRGVHGWTYPWLGALPPYRGLRVPARFGMLVLTGIAILAGVGCSVLTRAWGPRRGAIAAALVVLAAAAGESSASMSVREVPHAAPPVYAWLATLPPSVIAHLPLPEAHALPGADPEYQYFAQHHRHALVNGYSGFYPPGYLQLLAETRSFPDGPSLAALRSAGVEYLLLHAQFYPTGAIFETATDALDRRSDVEPIAMSSDTGGPVRVYRLRR
jgi:hypothetical protein